jgi:hypothetical protein
MDDLISSSYNNFAISKRESDGWVNLTQMCKANGKLLGHFLALKSTKAYFQAIESDIGKTISEIIEVKKGGDPKLQGSWGDPEIAILLAQWISPEFHRWCNAHIFVLMSDGKTSLDIDPFARMFEIMAENYRDVEDQTLIDDRFYDIEAYSSWSIESGN